MVGDSVLDTRQTVVDKVQALTTAKLKSDLDLSFTKVDLARAKLLLLEARNNFQASLAAVSAILGYQDEHNFQLVEPTMQIAPPAADPLPLILLALRQRPEISALEYQVESARKNSNAEHDLWRPTITALGAEYQQVTTLDGDADHPWN